MMKNLLFFALWIFACAVFAQETTTPDPYSEYSYLWQTVDKKAEKRKVKEAKKAKKGAPTQAAPIIAAPLISDQGSTSINETMVTPVTDTIPNNPTQNPVVTTPDSLIQEYLIAADTLPVTSMDSIPQATLDTIPEVVPTDTIPQTEEIVVPVEQEEEGEPEEAEIEPKEEEVKEKKEKEQRDPYEPKPDFRAGLPKGDEGSSIAGGFTYTRIGDEQFVGLTLAPNLKFGKVGVGLDVPVLYSIDNNEFRTEMYTDGVGVLRTIRYASYGTQKVDPVYVKFGTLTGTMVGFGGLVNNYVNSTSYEGRKLGAHIDISIKGMAGIEGMYSDFNFASQNLLAIRPYVRPLSFLGIPIVSGLEAGFTYVSDKDQTAIPLTDSTSTTYKFTEEGINAIGFDAGLPLLRIPFIEIDLFTQYSTLDVSSQALSDSLNALIPTDTLTFQKGNGFSVGFNFRFNFIADVITTDIRIDRLNYSQNYLPQFFDANYELNKDAKIFSLLYAEEMRGIYGSLSTQILQKVIIGGSLMLPDQVGVRSPALVSLTADIEKIAGKFSLHANYIKGGLTSLEDAFVLDENSLARARLAWQMNKFLVVGMDYFWSLNKVSDGSYEPSSYMSPYFGFNIDF